jgi:hypothetical protein
MKVLSKPDRWLAVADERPHMIRPLASRKLIAPVREPDGSTLRVATDTSQGVCCSPAEDKAGEHTADPRCRI